MIQVSIAGTDRSNKIKFGSLSIKDKINQGSDTCNFTVREYGNQTYKPLVGDEVIVTADGVRVYGGVIVSVDHSLNGQTILEHNVQCKDYTQYMDRKLIVERYVNQSVQSIILDLISRYCADFGFTGANVLGDTFNVNSVSFNEINMSAALTKLATLTGYYWYVDYYKDIHFFQKEDESAPFNITDTTNHIIDSLEISDDISQIRNKVKIRGGLGVGEMRTESYAGNGDQQTFPLGSKFSVIPTVHVDGVLKTVGVDFINQDSDFQVMWSYEQKYIRFTDGNTPGAPIGLATTNIDVTGLPLIPIVVQVQDASSVAEFGVYEYAKTDNSILSRTDAIAYARADLAGYANSLNDANFDTYLPGLRSGQTIQITSTKFGIDEAFIIQGVTFKQLTIDKYIWSVSVATVKTLSLIDVLQRLLNAEQPLAADTEVLLDFFQLQDNFTLSDGIATIVVHTTQNYTWEDATSNTETQPIVWDEFTWA